jgi:3',5'-nucleoside bisphosphate phosphatase
VHVLGYFIQPDAVALRAFLDRQRSDRVRRVAEMRDRLTALGCQIDVAPILAAAARGRSVGRPQIAEALVDAGYVQTQDEAFARFLDYRGAAYVPRFGASPAEVVTIIHDAGGIASLAHPGPTALDHLIAPLAAAGLDAIEAGHSDHDAATEARYRALAAELGLLVTGGSDFHGAAGHRTPRLGAVTLPAADFEKLSTAADRRRAH